MPMKCMDQMPKPIAMPPPTSHSRPPEVMRPAKLSAEYEATAATMMDSSTSPGS
jgi:hypothetical protein